MPSKRLPDNATDIEVISLCQQWTEELRLEISKAADIEAVRPRRNVSIHLAPIYRKRAAMNRWECTIDADWIESRLCALNDCCEVSGLPFDYSAPQKARKHFKHPMRPSLDRLDNGKGYTPENVRIVLHCVNIGINEWGLENYVEVCRAVAAAA